MNKTKNFLCLVAVWLLASLSAFAAEWEKPVPNECSPENGGKYYFYNPSADRFLDASGILLSLSAEGTPITLMSAQNGDWTMSGPNGVIYPDLDFVGSNGSDDELSAWCVEKQALATYYYIRPSKTDPNFLWETYPDMYTGINTTTWEITPLLKAGDGYIDWYLVAERDYGYFFSRVTMSRLMTELQGYGYDVTALTTVYNTATDQATLDAAIDGVQAALDDLRLLNASAEHPYDATARYMRNADLAENWVSDGHDVPGWTMVPSSFCGMGTFDAKGYYDDNKTLGSWSGGAFGDNSVYQQLEGLPNGKYRLGNNGLWIRHTGEDGDPIVGAYLYAKVGNKLFRQPLPDTGWWPGRAEVDFECRTGEAEVGIMFEGTNVGQCVILDFKLEYMGEIPVAERLATLVANAQTLIDEGEINAKYAEALTADIEKVRQLEAQGDAAAQETLYTAFTADYEEALYNKTAYASLLALVVKAESTLANGESEEMDALSDYLLYNELQENMRVHAYDNAQIDEIAATLDALVTKAANSVFSAGTDVTDLLINGHFDTTGGWKATLNDFSIDSGKKIMERWWSDWKAEQVLDNVPNGTYRMEVQGFQWCSWDWGQSESDWVGGDRSPSFNVTSKIRLNADETKIQNVFACGPTDINEGFQGGEYCVPNDATTALKYFALGLYKNAVETTVTDNTLKVEFDCSSNGFWNCFTNLRLIYVGADMEEATANLRDAMTKAGDYLEQKIEGALRTAFEEALATADGLLANDKAKYDDVNATANTLLALSDLAAVSAKEYQRLATVLTLAEQTLADTEAAQTTAGQQLQTLAAATKADYDSTYPSLDNAAIAATIGKLETLIADAKLGSGIKAGDDLTTLITNASFENTYGNDVSVGGAAHNVPYGWTMTIEGKECYTAQELTDAGINSWTAIEDNPYATDGDHSYCLLSAPVPDAYLWQTVEGLPAGTYRVSVDMNVTYDGGCSRLTGQRLLVNNVAQYYGKPEYYIADELDQLHPEETARTFAGYDEVNTNETGAVGDMGNLQTLTVEVTIGRGEPLTIGVRTDNNKVAMNRNYDENWWDCTGRYKLDNFRLVCVSIDTTGLRETLNDAVVGKAFNLLGVEVDPATAKGPYVRNGKIYVK